MHLKNQYRVNMVIALDIPINVPFVNVYDSVIGTNGYCG